MTTGTQLDLITPRTFPYGTLTGRVALVTGANRGLGLETSRQLLARGLTVVLAGRDTAALEHARRGLLDDERTVIVRLDVTGSHSIVAAHTGGFFRDRRAIEW